MGHATDVDIMEHAMGVVLIIDQVVLNIKGIQWLYVMATHVVLSLQTSTPSFQAYQSSHAH